MANKPSYSAARKARGTATMSIEPMPDKPSSFTDKDTQTRYLPQDVPAKGGTVSPNPNPKQSDAAGHLRDLSTT